MSKRLATAAPPDDRVGHARGLPAAWGRGVNTVTVRTMPRSTASDAITPARLRLLEYYLVHHDDLGGCVQASLEWLARHAGVRRSVCLAIVPETGTLVGVGGYGVPNDDVELFSWPVSDTHDPLTTALLSDEPTIFRSVRSNGHLRTSPVTPLGAGNVMAILLSLGFYKRGLCKL